MANKKVFTDESLETFVDEVKSYTDNAVSTKANSNHNHSASNITSGTLSSDRLPTVPIAKGGTGATTAAAALINLGITATASELNKLDGVTATTTELNYVDGVTSNIQTQLNAKVPTSRTVNGKALSANITLSASDVGASASSHTHDDRYYTESEIDSKLSGKANTSHGNHVPTTQTASNKVFLRNDNTWATVTPANIGAAASSHTHTVANITDLTATATELNYMDGVTSSVQAQLDSKASSSHTHDYMPLNPESIGMTGTKIYTNGSTTHGIQVNSNGTFVIGNIEDPYSWSDNSLIFSSDGTLLFNRSDFYMLFYGDSTQVTGSYTGNGAKRTINITTNRATSQQLLVVYNNSGTGIGFVTLKGAVWFSSSGATYYSDIYLTDGQNAQSIYINTTSSLFNTNSNAYKYALIYS